MELEVGMYVRTKQGYIAKFKKYDEIFDMLRFETPIFLRSWIPCDYMQKERFMNRYFLKASHNIIDLIERFDLVNGHLVICKMYENEKDIPTIVKCVGDYYFKEKDIQSIVTKEQFSAMEYRLGDE